MMFSFPTAAGISQQGAQATASTVPDQSNPASSGGVSAYSQLTGLNQQQQSIYLTNCGLNPDVAPTEAQWAECYQVNEGVPYPGPYFSTGVTGGITSPVPQVVWWALGIGGALIAFQLLK